MRLPRRTMLGATAATAAVAAIPARRARAQSGTLRLGVLTDMSGPYRDVTGPTSVACVRQAVEEFGAATNKGFDVEVIVGDHQNKPDVGVGIARRWFDQEGVDCIVDVPTSSVALAVASVVAEKRKAYLNTGAGTPDLTGKQCNPFTIHWGYDTIMIGRSTGGAVMRRGGDSWYFVTADYVFGQQLQRDTANVVKEMGGTVAGSAPYPFPETTDFSAYLLQATASRAKVIGFANAGADAVNSIKQAREFGLPQQGFTLVALLGSLNVAKALTPAIGQGLLLTETFYWDLNDRTRAFLKRVLPKTPENYPNMVQAASYSAVLHYLKTVADIGLSQAKADAGATMARYKATPAEDDAFGRVTFRPNGRPMYPAYLFQIKTPAESTGPWDLYKLIATTPADQAAPVLAEEGCPIQKS